LHDWRTEIIAFLRTLRLTLHEERAQVRPVTEGVPFLGFIVYPGHRRLKRLSGLAYRRRLKRLAKQYAAGQRTAEDLAASVRGWINHARYGDTWGLRRALFASIPIPGGPK